MVKSIVELLVGSLEEKRVYRQLMKRVNALPKDYRFAFKKIQSYLYSYGAAGCDGTLFTDLLELFEASSAEGKKVLDVIGSDVCKFCDELVHASAQDTTTSQQKFNEEILEHFNKEEK